MISITANPSDWNNPYSKNNLRKEEFFCTAALPSALVLRSKSFGMWQTFQHELQPNGRPQWLCKLRPCSFDPHNHKGRRIESHWLHKCSLCSLFSYTFFCVLKSRDRPTVNLRNHAKFLKISLFLIWNRLRIRQRFQSKL